MNTTHQSQISQIRTALGATELPLSTLPRLLFTEDLSKLLGLSVSTIRHYTGNAAQFGHLLPKWFKLPGARRLAWIENDVADWIKAGQSSAPSAKRNRGRPSKAEQVRRSTSSIA